MDIDLRIDEASVYCGFDYQLTDNIVIHNPTVEEIIKFGEQRYYSAVFMLTCIPSDMKYQLEDMGMNYMEVKDYDLFLFLSRQLRQQDTSLLLGELDLSEMEIVQDEQLQEPVLINLETGARIDRVVYMKLAGFLRMVHGIKPKVENAMNESTRKLLIQLDREKAAKAAKKPYKSQLKTIMSALMRTPSCTLSLSEIKQLPIYCLMDTLMGAQVFTATNALLIGSYSGMVDTGKLNKKEFDWMRDLQDEGKTQVLNQASQSMITK